MSLYPIRCPESPYCRDWQRLRYNGACWTPVLCPTMKAGVAAALVSSRQLELPSNFP